MKIATLFLAGALLIGQAAVAQNSFGNNNTNNNGATTAGTSSGQGNSFGNKPKNTNDPKSNTSSNNNPKSNNSSSNNPKSSSSTSSSQPKSSTSSSTPKSGSTGSAPSLLDGIDLAVDIMADVADLVDAFGELTKVDMGIFENLYGQRREFDCPLSTKKLPMKATWHYVPIAPSGKYEGLWGQCKEYGDGMEVTQTDIDMINGAIRDNLKIQLLNFAFNKNMLYILFYPLEKNGELKMNKKGEIAVRPQVAVVTTEGKIVCKDKLNKEVALLFGDPTTGGVWLIRKDGTDPLLYIYQNGEVGIYDRPGRKHIFSLF